MAVMRLRGKKYNVWFDYRNEAGEVQRQFETYRDSEQAERRKKVIDEIQADRNGKHDTTTDSKLENQARLYVKYRRLDELSNEETIMLGIAEALVPEEQRKRTHYDETFGQFIEAFLPTYARLNLQPASLEAWEGSLKNHILPFFGNRIMNNLDEQDIDEWLAYMGSKKVSGSKAYNKNPEELDTLSSATIAKAAGYLNVCFLYGKKRKWMREDLDVDKVRVTYQETPYWTADEFRENLPRLKDPLVRLMVHLLFILSGRPGEPAGIQMDSINLSEKWIHIKQSLTRVKVSSLERTDPQKIFFVFPKVMQNSTSVLVLKCPKTEMSVRTVRITKQLAEEIEARIRHIHHCKQLYGDLYQDYNLLICQDNGRPLDVRNLQRHFRKCLEEAGIEHQITLRGLRKSSLIYKNNLTGNDYTLVMKDSGHTQVGTLIKHYDDVNDQERIRLANHIEDDLYASADSSNDSIIPNELYDTMIRRILSDPEKMMQFMQTIASKPSLLHQVQQ